MSFWAGKRVLVTGHTGFKGAWLGEWLLGLEAKVFGLALAPNVTQPLFGQLGIADRLDHVEGDIRDAGVMSRRLVEVRPDIVFHLAAQPLVLASYDDPLETWNTNVMGSLHLMEALRRLDAPCTVVMVATDKVYENHETHRAYREADRLGGHDPYSASKAAMEIAISAWRRSFFKNSPVRLVSARAGNVIGGGDWAKDRIVPDIVRALQEDRPVQVRHSSAIRPFQHVLEPLSGYLRLAEKLATVPEGLADAYNFGPDPGDLKSVGELVEEVLALWPGEWKESMDLDAPHEAGLLSLDIETARSDLGYSPRWDSDSAIQRTVDWYRRAHQNENALALTRSQIEEFGNP